MGVCESKKEEAYTGHKAVPMNIANKTLKSICKIIVNSIEGDIYGTGFFMKINDSKKYLITNYHVISEERINDEIVIEIHNHKTMKLKKGNRVIKYFKRPKDITVIEIKNNDDIYKDIDFLDYDYNCVPNRYNIYENIDVFSIQHPLGDNAACGSGTIININNYELIEGVTYCININTLSEQGYLNKKIKDENLNDINTSKNVKLVYHNAKFDYDVVDSCTYYTVTFDANGGNVDIDSKEVIENSVYGTLPTPTRAGYTFMGWNGKNLFNERDWLLAINNATYDSEIGYYVFKVTDARNLYGRPYGSIPFKNFKENTQYTYTVMGHTVGREGANNTLKFYYYT